jgi:hypothetical protein
MLMGLIVLGILAMIFAIVVPALTRLDSQPASTPPPPPQPEDYAANLARANRLVTFLIQHMRPRPTGLQRADLGLIKDEYIRGRAAHWDFPLPRLNIDVSRPCWQARVVDADSEGRNMTMDVIITRSGQWAIFGRRYERLIVRGEMREIGDVAWSIDSGQQMTRPSSYHVRVLDGAIESILTRSRPSALPAYKALRES